MKETKIKCDVCGALNAKEGIKLQVIFHTEQTEGRGCEPYLSTETIDLCDDCHAKVLQGNYLHGTGVMGYNNYKFY
jgi:hypothetical protein